MDNSARLARSHAGRVGVTSDQTHGVLYRDGRTVGRAGGASPASSGSAVPFVDILESWQMALILLPARSPSALEARTPEGGGHAADLDHEGWAA